MFISRIHYANEESDGLQEMQELIISCVNEMIVKLSQIADISRNSIYAAVFVGNTTMTHLLMGLPPKNIAVAPFIPVETKIQELAAEDLDLNMNAQGVAVIIPSISAYIGADTVAAVLSCGLFENSEISLLIDIGTNAEVVIGNQEWMLSCSVAAGPAFEGARIRNGVGGHTGCN